METHDFAGLMKHKGHKVRVEHRPEDENNPGRMCLVCSCGVTLLLVQKDDIFLTKSENAIDCVDEIVEILWPGGDVDHEWDAEHMTSVANMLGEYGFGPHGLERVPRCKHEVNPHTVKSRGCNDPDPEVLDCICRLCGVGGSFKFENGTAEVMWPED